ncbi:hypothetical protein OEZ86_010467 [Tetradesmus obliquus]|nr:hypothetical protein OEZ86_010467 [Tetradesmus obliquus]
MLLGSMLRRTQQRLSCGANTLALALVFGVVILHVLHRRSAANVGPGDDQNVVFWFEAGDDGDDQPGFHRPFTWSLQLLAGAVGTFFIAALCDAGGIAGACSILGLFVPLYCLVAGFGLKEATALSQAAIAGASATSLAFNLFRAHPWDPHRPLVDLDLALLLAPCSLLGVALGVLLNDLLPRWLITAVLVGLLVHVSYREAMVGLTAWHEERHA